MTEVAPEPAAVLRPADFSFAIGSRVLYRRPCLASRSPHVHLRTAAPSCRQSCVHGIRRAGEWISSGFTNWNFAGYGVNVLWELRWRGVDAVIREVCAYRPNVNARIGRA